MRVHLWPSLWCFCSWRGVLISSPNVVQEVGTTLICDTSASFLMTKLAKRGRDDTAIIISSYYALPLALRSHGGGCAMSAFLRFSPSVWPVLVFVFLCLPRKYLHRNRFRPFLKKIYASKRSLAKRGLTHSVGAETAVLQRPPPPPAGSRIFNTLLVHTARATIRDDTAPRPARLLQSTTKGLLKKLSRYVYVKRRRKN